LYLPQDRGLGHTQQQNKEVHEDSQTTGDHARCMYTKQKLNLVLVVVAGNAGYGRLITRMRSGDDVDRQVHPITL